LAKLFQQILLGKICFYIALIYCSNLNLLGKEKSLYFLALNFFLMNYSVFKKLFRAAAVVFILFILFCQLNGLHETGTISSHNVEDGYFCLVAGE